MMVKIIKIILVLIISSLVFIGFFIGCSEKRIEDAEIMQENSSDDVVKNVGGINSENIVLENVDDSVLTSVVDTNQDKCYDSSNQINCPSIGDSFFGQDAQYLGNQASYMDNGDGTITSLDTGLMWVIQVDDKLDYYDAIGSKFNLAGYDDWRVPTVKELYSLMDFRGIDPDSQGTDTAGLIPFIDTDYFDMKYGDVSKGDRIIDSQWITSDVYVSDVMNGQECFFGVNFVDGRIKCYPTKSVHNNGYYLRYVRGEVYGENEFIDNGDGTITDMSSSLMWQQKDSAKGLNWEHALAYCEDLNFAGHDDWRLPNVKELQYIVDYSKSPDTTKTATIDSIFEVSEITNELGEKDYPFFWTSTTHISHVGVQSAAYISFGRAFGYMNGEWIDVHGAGAQRSDPKIGDPADYPTGHGPQGDAIRIYNYVRCVRNGAIFVEVESEEKQFDNSPIVQEPVVSGGSPPQEAISACEGKNEDSSCSFSSPRGSIFGICKNIGGTIACVP